MSYFNFFSHNFVTENESINGTCYEMCPAEEKTLRERERLIHNLEVLGSTRQLVKCYSRSAADSNIAIPSRLRPFHVLQKTVQYLLLSVTQRTDVSTSRMYDFIDDRLRAVRQDVTIQRLPPDQCMQLLEPMIRFYVYFGYRLSGSPLNEFDPVLNKKYLLECIKWFLHCSDVLKEQTATSKEDDLTSLMSNWSIDKETTKKLSCDKILVESLYMLCNMNDLHPLHRYLSLPSMLKRKAPLRLAYEITLSHLHGNFVRTSRLAKKLCPLIYYAFILYLPTLQRDALQTMSVAYSSRGVPSSALQYWLGFINEEATKAACVHYGLKVDEDQVLFTKGALRSDAELFKPKMDMTPRVDLPFEEVLTYES